MTEYSLTFRFFVKNGISDKTTDVLRKPLSRQKHEIVYTRCNKTFKKYVQNLKMKQETYISHLSLVCTWSKGTSTS